MTGKGPIRALTGPPSRRYPFSTMKRDDAATLERGAGAEPLSTAALPADHDCALAARFARDARDMAALRGGSRP